MTLNQLLAAASLCISFAMANGKLNENFYCKSFAFNIALFTILIITIIKRRGTTNATSFYFIDIMVIGLAFISLYTYNRLFNNIIDFSIPFMLLLLYLFVRLYYNKDLKRTLSCVVPIVMLIHLALCTLQYFSYFPNYSIFFDIGSTFGNPDMLSAYLSILLPFCYISHQQKTIRWTITLLTICLFFFLQARTAIIATAITLICYYIHIHGITKRQLLTGVVGILISILFLIYWHPISVLGRFYIWVVSLSMLINKPLGWGAYAFEKYYPEYQAQFTVQHPQIVNMLNYDIVHSPYNEFLNIAVTSGVIGLLLYVLFTLFIMRLAYNKKSIFLFPLITFQILSLTYFPFRIIPLTVIYVICCASVVSSYHPKQDFILSISFRVKRLSTYIITCLVALCTGYCTYCFYHWQDGIKLMDKKEYAKAYFSFEKSYFLLQNNGRFLISLAELEYKRGEYNTTLQLMEEANKYFSDIPLLHNLAMLYEQKGMIDKAKEKLNLAVNMSPDNIDIRFAQIQFLQRIGEKEKALQKAIDLRNRIKKETQDNNSIITLISLDKLIDQ